MKRTKNVFLSLREYISDSYQEKQPDVNALGLIACSISTRAATLGR